MSLDKELYRQAREWYRQINDVELTERVLQSGQMNPQESFNIYANLWSLAMELSTSDGEKLRELRYIELGKYYDRVKKLEEWRMAHGG
jgi:hypothetical protein